MGRGITIADFVSIDFFPQNRAPASGPRPARPLASNKLGIRFSHSIFGLESFQRFTMHTRGVSLGFASGMIIGTGYTYRRSWLQHRASRRGAEPQCHQNINNKFEFYSVGTGLSKRTLP